MHLARLEEIERMIVPPPPPSLSLSLSLSLSPSDVITDPRARCFQVTSFVGLENFAGTFQDSQAFDSFRPETDVALSLRSKNVYRRLSIRFALSFAA